MSQDEELLSIRFQQLINPRNLFRDFTEKDFLEYVDSGSVASLQAMLVELEKEEMYEHCVIVNNTIKEKTT